jgi:hypothetical protein
MQRKTLTAALLAASALAAGAAQAAPAVVAGTAYAPHTTVQYAPPAPIHEATPAPRAGYDWVAGHYEWRNGQYAWTPGYWIAARAGQTWEEARWVRDNNGQWYMVGGRWVDSDDYYASQFNDRRYNSQRFGPNGDLDGDGIRNRDDNDRDGDGVANWTDDFPNNSRRS